MKEGIREFYIYGEDDKLLRTSEEIALTKGTYGLKTKERGHIQKHHTECDSNTCVVCNLYVCMVCGSYEGGLTTHCCGHGLSMEEIDDVYKGKKDFRYGKWLNGVINQIMIRDIETVNKNHEEICKVFKEEIDKGTELGCEISDDILHEFNEWKRVYEKYNII